MYWNVRVLDAGTGKTKRFKPVPVFAAVAGCVAECLPDPVSAE